jgi:Type IV secretion-system coupling protein DNA-binding domain
MSPIAFQSFFLLEATERTDDSVGVGARLKTMDNGEHFVCIGNRAHWGHEGLFGLRKTDRRQHAYVIGKSGTGKTTLLRNLILQDIEAGQGVGVIDPHGDLAEEILDHIPPWRTDHVTYFNPADERHPMGFNPFQANESAHLVASGIVGSLKSIWRDSWGPRLEYILYAAVAALVECGNTTFLGVQRMLIDERYRSWVVRQIKDVMVRSFWIDEFKRYDERFLQEAIAPIQNKVGQLLMAAPLRNIFGQVKNRIDARFLMNHKRIFIANLSKGRIGEDKANLLGAMLVTRFQQAANRSAVTSWSSSANGGGPAVCSAKPFCPPGSTPALGFLPVSGCWTESPGSEPERFSTRAV